MKRNGLWLNVKAIICSLLEKTFEVTQKKPGLYLIEIQNNAIPLIFGCF